MQGFHPRSCHQRLMDAVIGGHEPSILAALADGGDPNRQDRLGDTPLLWAAVMGHADLLDLLVSRGGDPSQRNAQGDTLLHAAARQGQQEVLRRWAIRGLDREVANDHGQTPWTLALAWTTSDLAATLASVGPEPLWTAQPLVAAQRLHQALVQGELYVEAVLRAGGAVAWDIPIEKWGTPWAVMVKTRPLWARLFRPEGAPVLPFRRRIRTG